VHKACEQLLAHARAACPSLQPTLQQPAGPPPAPLPPVGAHDHYHISLSRVTAIRQPQAAPLLRALTAQLRGVRPERLSLSRLAVFVNDEGTRTFLSLLVGRGSSQASAGQADGPAAWPGLQQQDAGAVVAAARGAAMNVLDGGVWGWLQRCGQVLGGRPCDCLPGNAWCLRVDTRLPACWTGWLHNAAYAPRAARGAGVRHGCPR
jgi:hypothetical protein